MPAIDGVFIKSFPGSTIAALAMHIDKGHVNFSNYDYLILHVGTNDIQNTTVHVINENPQKIEEEKGGILSDFGNLIARIKNKKASIRIIVSSILPRPCDHEYSNDLIKDINKKLRLELAPDLGFHFVESWKAVSKFGTFRRYLYAKNDRGLHLNTEGSRRLRYFFLRVISTIDGLEQFN